MANPSEIRTMRMIAPKKEKAVALPDGLNRTKRANVIATRRNRTPPRSRPLRISS